MRNAALAALAVVLASIVARALVPSFSLYLEPYEIVKQWHVWQLVTWVVTGASLTFLAHAALLAFATWKGAPPKTWLAIGFAAGALTTLLAYAVPAVFSCTFTGAGVSATAALSTWASTLKGPRRAAATALALAPAGLDAAVDGLYMLVPFGFAFLASALWVRWRRRSHPAP